jgi:hypothetical protein
MMSPVTQPSLTPEETAQRRRKIRTTALWLLAFAVAVYGGAIAIFITRHA